MKHTWTQGLTLVELLVTLGIFTLIFTVLANGAIANLRGTTVNRNLTEVKTKATQKLDSLSAQIMSVSGTGTAATYAFSGYYDTCVGTPLPESCQGKDEANGISWTIQSEKDAGTTAAEKYTSEGQILVFVKVTGRHGGYDLTRRLSCYDVLKKDRPTTSHPAPCPSTNTTLVTGGL